MITAAEIADEGAEAAAERERERKEAFFGIPARRTKRLLSTALTGLEEALASLLGLAVGSE